MVKGAALVLLLAVLGLTASSLAWLRATSAASALPEGASGQVLIAELERTTRPDADIDLAARYAGRLELLDPRLALPQWHTHARDDAARLYAATRACPTSALPPLADAALAKAAAWHSATCGGSSASAIDELVDRPPFMHPSGRSYAALAHALGGPSSALAWTRAHARSFHVLELAALEPAPLEPPERALAALDARAWEALARGDRLVLTASSLLVAEHGPLGLAKVRVHSRATWESFSHDAALALRPRGRSSICAQPASLELCWETRTAAERHRPAFFAWTTSSAAVVLGASFVLAFAYAGERRRLNADRIHVLRTLTHELRTPATGLRLDIEPLRAAYDDLPASCQEPLLRISDGIERLHRVLHRSARYLALFESHGRASESLAKLREVPSTKTMFEELQDEWPEDVVLTADSDDGPVTTDPDWLGVAVRNLVENGVRHGKAPVRVAWRLDEGALVVRVSDAGTTPKLSLRRAVAPHERDERSPGLGLGLAIVDRVAELLGGRLSHEPAPTTFVLRLPAQKAPRGPAS